MFTQDSYSPKGVSKGEIKTSMWYVQDTCSIWSPSLCFVGFPYFLGNASRATSHPKKDLIRCLARWNSLEHLPRTSTLEVSNSRFYTISILWEEGMVWDKIPKNEKMQQTWQNGFVSKWAMCIWNKVVRLWKKNNDWNILSKTNAHHFSCVAHLFTILPSRYFPHRRNAQGFGEPEASWKGTRMWSLGWWHDKTHHPPVQSSPQLWWSV